MQCHSRWKLQDRILVKNTDDTKTKHNPEKAINAKHNKTKLPWFSHLLQHSARKRGGLQCSRAHTGIKETFADVHIYLTGKVPWQPTSSVLTFGKCSYNTQLLQNKQCIHGHTFILADTVKSRLTDYRIN